MPSNWKPLFLQNEMFLPQNTDGLIPLSHVFFYRSAEKRFGSAYPIHWQVLVARCRTPPISKLPEQGRILRLPWPGRQFRSVQILLRYIYDLDWRFLLRNLLPGVGSIPDIDIERDIPRRIIYDLRQEFFQSIGPTRLLENSKVLVDIWELACSWGIRDEFIWKVLETAWQINKSVVLEKVYATNTGHPILGHHLLFV